jgi:hypothetical protein
VRRTTSTAELSARRWISRRDASLGTGYRFSGGDRIGTQRPYDLHVSGRSLEQDISDLNNGLLPLKSPDQCSIRHRVTLPVVEYRTWRGTVLEGMGVVPEILEPFLPDAAWTGVEGLAGDGWC